MDIANLNLKVDATGAIAGFCQFEQAAKQADLSAGTALRNLSWSFVNLQSKVFNVKNAIVGALASLGIERIADRIAQDRENWDCSRIGHGIQPSGRASVIEPVNPQQRARAKSTLSDARDASTFCSGQKIRCRNSFIHRELAFWILHEIIAADLETTKVQSVASCLHTLLSAQLLRFEWRCAVVRFSRAVCFLAVLVIAFAPMALAQGTYTQIDVPGSMFTYVYGINTSGEIVGEYEDSDIAIHGFVLSGGSYTAIDYPGASITAAIGINDNAQIVGVADIPPNTIGFIYDRSTGVFTDITYQGQPAISAVAINNAGTIVAYAPSGSGFYKDVAGREVTISISGANSVNPLGITGAGEVVGYYSDHTSLKSFEWLHRKSRRVSIPNAPYALVYGTNPAGTGLVGTYLAGAPTDSFLYQHGLVRTLAYPGARDTYAYGASANGQVTGIYYYDSGGPHGFIWTPPADAGKKSATAP